jgi:hypothetical protein
MCGGMWEQTITYRDIARRMLHLVADINFLRMTEGSNNLPTSLLIKF